jgi:hypothetical protein
VQFVTSHYLNLFDTIRTFWSTFCYDNFSPLQFAQRSNAVKRQPLVVKEMDQLEAAASGIFNREAHQCPPLQDL